MLTFSTDDLRPRERFDYWCEVRARNLFGVTISLPQDERQHFQGRFTALPIGGATLSKMQASPYNVSRSTTDISRASSDSLCIYQQTSGASWFSTRNGSEFVVQTNDIAISHTDVPYLTRPATAHGFDLRVLKIPLAGRNLPARSRLHLAPSPIRNDPRLSMVISTSFAIPPPRPPKTQAPTTTRRSIIWRNWRCWRAAAFRPDHPTAGPRSGSVLAGCAQRSSA
jgi:hypothetical protein